MRAEKSIITWCIAIMVLVVCFPLSLQAAAGDGKGQTVRVGYVSTDGFIDKDKMGIMRGYGVAYLNQIASYTGWDYEYVYETRDKALKRLEKGEIDLLCNVQITDERREVLDFAEFSIGRENSILYTLSDNTDIAFQDYKAMDGKKIALVESAYEGAGLQSHAEKKGFSYEVLKYQTVEDVLEALESGEAQMALLGTLDSRPGFKIVDRYAPTPYYIATRKDNTEVLNLLNEALENINAITPYFSYELYGEYQHADRYSSVPLFTREEIDYLSEERTVKVACGDGYYPLVYADRTTGEPAGIIPDILQEISKRSGIEFQLQMRPIKETEKDMLGEKDVDAISAIVYSQGLAQQDNMQISDIYFDSSMVVIAKTDYNLRSKENAKIVLPQVYETLVRYDKTQGKSDAQVTFMKTAEECLDAVRKGEADATVQNVYVANYFLQSAKYKNLSIIVSNAMEEGNAMLFTDDMDPMVISIINKTIHTISPDETTDIVANYTKSNPYQDSFSNFWYAYGSTVVIVSMTIAVAVIILIASNQRRTKILLQLRENEAYQAITERDVLTGLYSRQAFYDRVRRYLNDAENANGSYEIMYFNVEKFKVVNELFGVKKGDSLICYIAESIQQWGEENGAICARFETDHFAVFAEKNEKSADTILSIIYRRLDEFQTHIQLDISCGVYHINEPGRSVNLMCDRAHLAADSIKGRHFQRVAVYDDSHRSQMIQEQVILNEMEGALQEEQFHVYLQPKYNMKTEKIIGAEALVRWVHPARGIISPGDFIPVFEHNGFISKLDMYMYRKTCILQRKWADEGKELYPISVNLSRANFYNINLCKNLCDIAEEYKIPRKYLQLEIVETAYANDMEVMGARMLELQQAGFLVLMDDFGSGYSSFNMLKDAPIDVVKMDMRFLSMSDPYNRGESILEMIIGLGQRLDLPVLAEGVESKKHVDMLLGYGCYMAQGYYYSRPIPVDEYEEILYGQNEEKTPE